MNSEKVEKIERQQENELKAAKSRFASEFIYDGVIIKSNMSNEWTIRIIDMPNMVFHKGANRFMTDRERYLLNKKYYNNTRFSLREACDLVDEYSNIYQAMNKAKNIK